MPKAVKQPPIPARREIASTYRDSRGREREATEKMRALVDGLVYGGLKPKEAARAAGYSETAINQQLRQPGLQAFLRQERERAFAVDLAPRAIETLRQVMGDSSAPAAARVTAARTALEVAGDLRRAGDDPASGKRLSELSADQLASMLDTMQVERDRIAAAVERDRQAIDGIATPIPSQEPARSPAWPRPGGGIAVRSVRSITASIVQWIGRSGRSGRSRVAGKEGARA